MMLKRKLFNALRKIVVTNFKNRKDKFTEIFNKDTKNIKKLIDIKKLETIIKKELVNMANKKESESNMSSEIKNDVSTSEKSFEEEMLKRANEVLYQTCEIEFSGGFLFINGIIRGHTGYKPFDKIYYQIPCACGEKVVDFSSRVK